MGGRSGKWRGSWPGKTDRVGYLQFVVGEKMATPDPKEVALRTLRTGVNLMVDGDIELVEEEEHRTRIVPGGFHAYRRWWDYLQRDIRYGDIERREQFRLFMFNGRFLTALIEARKAASDYLSAARRHRLFSRSTVSCSDNLLSFSALSTTNDTGSRVWIVSPSAF